MIDTLWPGATLCHRGLAGGGRDRSGPSTEASAHPGELWGGARNQQGQSWAGWAGLEGAKRRRVEVEGGGLRDRRGWSQQTGHEAEGVDAGPKTDPAGHQA